MFQPGTTATLVNPDSSLVPLTTINVRATEYTVGDSGRLAMPAPLPPASRYTYAVEVSVDEAGPGATVVFSQPVPLYVENFLNIPVGTPVPTGRYDRTQGAWVPERNGVVLKVISIDGNGRAQVDVTGDDVADGANALNLLGISDYEQVQLAGAYPAGTDLWRALVRRTAAQDLNYPWVEVGSAPTEGKVRAGCSARGSDPIRCQLQAQTAFQSVGLVGSPFTLNYASDRTQGNGADRRLDITLTGATLPPFLMRVELEVDVAGQRFRGSFTPAANLTHTFQWDGTDIYNRTVQGVQPVTVLIGYVFPVFYARPAPGDTSFALPCLILVGGCQLPGAPLTIPRAEQVEVQVLRTSLGTGDAQALGLGGFTLDAQHVYDPVGQTLFQGDGTRRAAAALPPGVRTVAGNGGLPFFNPDDGIPATTEELGTPRYVAVAPDGTLYLADFRNQMHIRKVTADGLIQTVVGSVGGSGPNGDGGPASLARITNLFDLATGPDGSLYLLENTSKVRKIDPAGIITTVAGTGTEGFWGDGGPATAAGLKTVRGIAVGPDGSLYIADGGNHRVRRVGTDGIIQTIAGTGASCGSPFFHPTDADFNAACGNAIPASQARLQNPQRVAVGPDGAVYLLDDFSMRVRRIGPDGVIRTVVGNPGQIPNGDGGPVGLASIYGVKSLAAGPDGSLYITQAPVDARPVGCRIRRVDPTGIITTVVGTVTCGFGGDGGPAPAAVTGEVLGLAVGPDGNLYFGDAGANRVRRVSGFLPQFGAGQTTIATEDGGAVAGRHHFWLLLLFSKRLT